MGIDIAFIEALIAGEAEIDRFAGLVAHYRAGRHRQRLRDTSRLTGSARYELQQTIEREYARESEL